MFRSRSRRSRRSSVERSWLNPGDDARTMATPSATAREARGSKVRRNMEEASAITRVRRRALAPVGRRALQPTPRLGRIHAGALADTTVFGQKEGARGHAPAEKCAERAAPQLTNARPISRR